jgi:hypothetical protein
MTSAISARVATDRQAQAPTIEPHIERLHARLQDEDQLLGTEVIVRDEGSRGATRNRPGRDRLRAQLREGLLQRGRITCPERLARTSGHPMVRLEACERDGCQGDFRDQPMPHAPHAHLLVHMRGAVAAYDRPWMAARRRRGRHMQLRVGLCLPGPCLPYGYRGHPDRPRDPQEGARELTAGARVQA